MESGDSKADKKVHFRDSREVMLTYKRRRWRQPEQQPAPQAQARKQPDPQQNHQRQAQARAKPKPQQQPQAPAQSEPQPRPELKHEARDVPAQESKDTFWKSRDMGWKYGIMIDENRQHWKCMYCGLIRYAGGVSRLKRHLAGDLDVKMCPRVPANVAEEIRVHLQKKRERQRKRDVRNGWNNIKLKSSSNDGIVDKDLLPADMVGPVEMDNNILEEVTNQTSMVHQDPTCPRVWEDLKMAGQNIVELANNLSSVTESSCRNLVEREKESDANELKGVNQLHQSDRVDLDQSYPVDMDQSDPVDVSDIRDSTCNHCDKEARGGSVLTCTKCLLSCHISCTEPTDASISIESWCCRNCRMDKIEGDMVLAHYQPSTHYQPNCLHKNCVSCDRLEMCSYPKCKDTPNDNSKAMVLYGVGSEEDSELPEIDTVGSCKIYGNPEEEDKMFLICGHDNCLYKYYHIRCLKSKQVATDFQCDKRCWYCPSCLCRVCLSDKDDDLTILCDGCDEAYHLYCIRPRHTSIPKGQWNCSSCSAKRAKGGIRRYERRVLKLHRKVDTRLQSKKYDGVNLLLSAVDMLKADE